MAAIALSHVSKVYRGEVFAVRDASLSVPSGAFCALVGPSGCGKSTLLRLIAAKERVTSGLIEIGDAAHQSWLQGRPEVAELVDPRSFDPRRTLYDNMTRDLARRGLKKAEVEERILRAADAMELGPLLARTPGRVSAGERARAALARAFAHQPAALLFDEPLAELDAARRLAVRRALKRAQRESDATAIFATHDPTDALALADLIAVMKDGAILQAGTPDEVYDRPASVTVAALLGSPPMNLLPVRANQTGLSLEDGTHFGAASVMTSAVHAVLGVRPEHLTAVEDEADGFAARFPMTVEEVERAGADFYVHGRVGGRPMTARLHRRPSIAADGRLTLGAAREHLHMFDASSGARL